MLDMVPPKEKDPLLIVVTVQHDGAVYSLSAWGEDQVRERFPAQIILSCVFLGHRTAADFPDWHVSRWPKVPEVLTGLTLEQLAELNGVRLYATETQRVLWEWLPAHVRAG